LNAKQRMSFAQWNSYQGICGHEHAPENDHGDPGNIWTRLAPAIEKVTGGALPSAPALPPAQATKYAMGWAMLRQGDTGSDTKELQQWLNANFGQSLDTDGAFGSKTHTAVKSFQTSQGLRLVDGIVGPDTQNAMKSYKKGSAPAQPAPGNAPPFPLPSGWAYGPASGGNEIVSGIAKRRDGITGEGLKVWQRQMKEVRGWNGIGAISGKYDSNTAKVTVQFQQEKGLKPDGLIGRDTWNAAWNTKIT
jgi:peptidoglycan hydrolase-like protein with peptidoglycan-binding domain